MNILIYQPRCSYYVGGGEVIPLQQAEYLAKKGHHITFVTTKSEKFLLSDYFNNFINNNPSIDVIYIHIDKSLEYIYEEEPGSGRYRWNNESLHVARQALPVIQSINCDVYVAHQALDALALPIGEKCVVHLHGYPEEINYAYELALSYGYKYIAVSELVKTKWLSMTNINSIDVVYNGINTEKFYYNESKKNIDIVYVGRLIEVKGVQHLIQSIHILHEKYQIDLKLSIVGVGPYEKELRSLVSKYSIQDLVDFIGYVDEKDLPGFYRSSKLAVLPSLSREGVLTTMLESSACGTPVLTTEGTSMVEFIGFNEESGFLAPIENPDALAQKILHIFNKEDQLMALGQKVSQLVKNKRSRANRISELERIYLS